MTQLIAHASGRTLAWLFGLVTLALLLLYVGLVALVTASSRADLRGQILSRDAELLSSVTLWEAARTERLPELADTHLLPVALATSDLRGVVGVNLWMSAEEAISVPGTLYANALAAATWQQLEQGETLRTYHPGYPLAALFSDIALTDASTEPLLEVLVPVHAPEDEALEGVIQYWIDGHSLAAEFAELDAHLIQQVARLGATGAVALVALMSLAYGRIARLHRDLQRRTLELEKANAELTLAAKTSAVGAITAHLVHGLKNPLAGLRMHFAQEAGSGEAAELTQRMQTLLAEVTSVLRQQERESRVNWPLSDLIETLRQQVQPNLDRAELCLVTTLGEASRIELPAKTANLVLLIARNLIDNAIEASPNGGTVRLSAAHDPAGLCLRVADQGEGVPEALRERLFTPVASDKAGGSGLGLAISQQLARQIEGELALEASGPSGSTFTLTLPLSVVAPLTPVNR